MSKKLSFEEKVEIKIHLENKKTQQEIAEMYQVSQSTISRLKKKIEETNTCARKPGSGRPSLLNEEDTSFLIKKVKEDPKIGTTVLASEIKKTREKDVSPRTIRRKLSDIGYKGRLACKKPFLSKKNILARLKFAKEHISWSDERWDKVVFSDESKFNLFGSDGRRYVRREDNTRYKNKNLIPTVKHGGGSVMVWACFSSSGVGNIQIIEGIMDRYEYSRILDSNLHVSVKNFNLSDYIFQQDNDPKHTSKHVKEYFADRKINVMKWPPQSPDLNPIENLWYIVKINVAKRQPKNLKELAQFIVEEWKKIDKNVCEKLIRSMTKRCREVINNKGGHTSF